MEFPLIMDDFPIDPMPLIKTWLVGTSTIQAKVAGDPIFSAYLLGPGKPRGYVNPYANFQVYLNCCG